MKFKVSAVRTSSWAMLSLAGLACLASACSSSNTSSGTGGATGSGGATASGGSGMGGSGTGGAAAGGAPGMGGSGAGGAVVDAGGDHSTTPTDSGAMDAVKDAIVVHDGATTTGGAYVRTGWTAVAMPDHVAPAQTVPQSNESLATSNAFDGMNGTRWATGVYQDALTAMFPLYFTVDMKQVMNIGRITLYAGSQDTGDYPVQLDVLVSNDGVNFTTAAAAHRPAPPATGIDTINITPPVIGQWIQLKATMGQPMTNRRWWAIGEMNVYP
jgi:hypothetical protein